MKYEKTQPPTVSSWKGGRDWIVFSAYCGYSSTPHPNLTVLKDYLQYGIRIFHNKIFPITLKKITGLPCIWNGSFTHGWFYNSMPGGKILVHIYEPDYVDLAMSRHLTMCPSQKKKITLLVSPPIPSEKSLLLGSCQAHSSKNKFSKILTFSLESSNFITGHKNSQPFSSKWQDHFIHLKKKERNVYQIHQYINRKTQN